MLLKNRSASFKELMVRPSSGQSAVTAARWLLELLPSSAAAAPQHLQLRT
jgi:hypothetical protein